MKKFIYQARDKATGNIIKSMVQADSETEAAKILTKQGYLPLSIKEEVEGGILAGVKARITSKDKIVFSRQLATLIGAGLPLVQSLRTVLEQTSNKKMQEVIQQIVADIEGGKSLSVAFGRHPKVFSKLYLALIAAGEVSGTLDDSLKRIATQQEKDAAIMSRIRGAMTYPLIVLAVIIAVAVFMMVMVVPQVAKLYDDMKKELPIFTKILIEISNFTVNYWWLVLIVLGIVIFFTKQYIATDSGRRVIDTVKLNIPLFSGMFRKLYMARFARTAQTLLVTGVPMLDALAIASDGVSNVVVSEQIDRAAEKVQSGKALSESLKNEEYILQMVPQMIKIGEQSGKIDEMLGKTAQVYEDELDEEIKALSTMIEPIMMVIMALFAAGMIGAILFPVYSIVGSI